MNCIKQHIWLVIIACMFAGLSTMASGQEVKKPDLSIDKSGIELSLVWTDPENIEESMKLLLEMTEQIVKNKVCTIDELTGFTTIPDDKKPLAGALFRFKMEFAKGISKQRKKEILEQVVHDLKKNGG